MKALEKYYSIQEAAFLLGMHPNWVRKRLRAGDFHTPCTCPVFLGSDGRDIRIPASAINAFLDNRKVREPGVAAADEMDLRRRMGLRPRKRAAVSEQD